MKLEPCRLCHAATIFFQQARQRFYVKCTHCSAVMMVMADLPSSDVEYREYQLHDNDVNDPLYQQFVSPITDAVQQYYDTDSLGLDFGAGPGPVIQNVLAEQGYHITVYDPFFYPDTQTLTQQYDFVTCSEVIEHFHYPDREFEGLKNLLKPEGRLICMTRLIEDTCDFQRWGYKNDPTHVFFYHRNSLDYICQRFGFSVVQQSGRLIIWSL